MNDDPQALRYIRYVLTRAGYAPIATGDPTDVPRVMAEHKPHLVLLDLAPPGTDGIGLMNQVHGMAEVPVIFLSEYGQGETVARAFDMRAVEYLIKPFRIRSWPTVSATPTNRSALSWCRTCG